MPDRESPLDDQRGRGRGPSRPRRNHRAQAVAVVVAMAIMLSAGPGTAISPAVASTPNEVQRLLATPDKVVLKGKDGRQQLAITGWTRAGEVGDVTRMVTYEVENPAVAAVAPSGLVTPLSNGKTTVYARLGSRMVAVPVEARVAETHQPVSYRRDVVALLARAGCNQGACHGNFNGKGGFRLSLRGEDPTYDLFALTRDALGRRINRAEPDQSLIVLKPSGAITHEGGVRFSSDSIEARALRDWIGAGQAGDDLATAPTVIQLQVFPPERKLDAMTPAQQLVVTATFSDGTSRDVTRLAAYDLSEPTHFTISLDGLVDSERPGEVVVAVRYLQARAVSRLAFLPDRPDFAWNPPVQHNEIDSLAFSKLKAMKVNPSPPADDSTFLRRVFLDVVGVLPTVEETRAFLADPDPSKRSRLIERLVDRPEFADFWAWKWADLLRNEEKTMGEKGIWIFQRWLRDELAADAGLDQITRALVSSTGSTWNNPPSAFHRTNRDPETAAETVAQVFLGVRLQCARCHNHPFDLWTQNDYYGLAAYFSNLQRKQIDNNRRDDLDKHEITGDELVYIRGMPRMVQPRSGVALPPKPPGGPVAVLGDDPVALDDLARWLTEHNPQFERNLANRVWFHLMGRGLVEPVDDFRETNPASNPELLGLLARRFADNGHRLKPLVRFIAESATYQLSATPNSTNDQDEINHARAAAKLLPAEVLLDAIGQALDAPERFQGSPRTTRAVQLPGARMGGSFLKVFGKPDRLLTCECERSESTTLAQSFQLINGESVRRSIETQDNRIGRRLTAGVPPESLLEELTLATLCRRPTAAERTTLLAHVSKAGDDLARRRRAWEDIVWALINSKEFLLRH